MGFPSTGDARFKWPPNEVASARFPCKISKWNWIGASSPTSIDRRPQLYVGHVFRLENDYRALCRLSEQLSPFQRYFPSKRFQADIATFEDQVNAFYADAWVSVLPRLNWLSLCFRRKRLRLGIGRLIGSH